MNLGIRTTLATSFRRGVEDCPAGRRWGGLNLNYRMFRFVGCVVLLGGFFGKSRVVGAVSDRFGDDFFIVVAR